jgi:hypothetical protein
MRGTPLSLLALLVAAALVRALPLDQLPPQTKSVFLNIGSNLEPLVPPADNDTVVTIAFEPIVHARIQPHPRIYVVPAAVAGSEGLAMMAVLNKDSVSSSLAAPTNQLEAMMRNRHADATTHKMVPMLSMKAVLHSVPPRLTVWFLKTDMQGFDFIALHSAGSHLRRAHYVMTEVYIRGASSYNVTTGGGNDYCKDWLPFMLSIGYEPMALAHGEHNFRSAKDAHEYCANEAGFLKKFPNDELDAFWKLKGTPLPPPPTREWTAPASLVQDVGSSAPVPFRSVPSNGTTHRSVSSNGLTLRHGLVRTPGTPTPAQAPKPTTASSRGVLGGLFG